MSLDAIFNFFMSIPTDWIILVAFTLFAALDVVRSGVQRVCALVLALPVASFLFSALSGAIIVGPVSKQFSTPVLQAILFALIFIGMYVLVSRMGISYGGESGQPIQALIAGIAATGILITIWVQTPALQYVWHFGSEIRVIFGELYRFWWIIGSYAALAFVRS